MQHLTLGKNVIIVPPPPFFEAYHPNFFFAGTDGLGSDSFLKAAVNLVVMIFSKAIQKKY